MRPAPAPDLPADYRLARLQKWVALSLVWFAAHVLALIAPDAARAWLDAMRRNVRLLLLARALKQVRLPAKNTRPRCYDPGSVRAGFSLRAMIGLDVNRALRGHGLRESAGALHQALTHPDRLIARIVRRLNRRFTRRRRMRRLAFRTPAPRMRATPPRAVDSS